MEIYVKQIRSFYQYRSFKHNNQCCNKLYHT